MDDFLDGKLGQYIQTDWERFCTEENAIKAQEDIGKIATLLYEEANAIKKIEGPVGLFCFGLIHGATM